MKSILITGGAGYIGSHVSLSLLQMGYNVFSIDSFINSSYRSVNVLNSYSKNNINNGVGNFYFFKGDIRDQFLLKKIFDNAKSNNCPIDAVIHFAALKSVNESTELPLKYWSNNIFGTINLLKIMEKFSCYNLIFSSSATVYGITNISPIPEDNLIDPINPYGKTKAYVESMLSDLINSNDNSWKIRILRYFNPVGSHSTGLLGEEFTGNNGNLFPIICNTALNKLNVLNIYGDDWPTNDGTCVRDYVHIMDLTSGHIKCLESINESKDNFLIFNLGTGKGTSVLEMINTFERVNKIEVNYKFAGRREGDCAILVANCDLIRKKLNWKSKKTIEDMCIDGWQWRIKSLNK